MPNSAKIDFLKNHFEKAICHLVSHNELTLLRLTWLQRFQQHAAVCRDRERIGK